MNNNRIISFNTVFYPVIFLEYSLLFELFVYIYLYIIYTVRSVYSILDGASISYLPLDWNKKLIAQILVNSLFIPQYSILGKFVLVITN